MEIERVIQILASARQEQPCPYWRTRCGTTAIVEGLAQRIIEGMSLPPLLGKRVLQLDVGSLSRRVTMYRGQFEERLKRVIDELKLPCHRLIDELHMLVGAGAAGSAMGCANSP